MPGRVQLLCGGGEGGVAGDRIERSQQFEVQGAHRSLSFSFSNALRAKT